MIVKDEIINPRGGIYSMLTDTLPRVEKALVVDTGSKDGTREVLEHLKSKYPILDVLDYPDFTSFWQARQYANDNVSTRYSFIMDADELLSAFEAAALFEYLRTNKGQDFYASLKYMINIDQTGNESPFIETNPNRLFSRYFVRFKNDFWEDTVLTSALVDLAEIDASIHHFGSSENGFYEKRKWYTRFGNWPEGVESQIDNPSFLSWKTPNMGVLDARGIPARQDFQEVIDLDIPIPQKIAAKLYELIDSKEKSQQ